MANPAKSLNSEMRFTFCYPAVPRLSAIIAVKVLVSTPDGQIDQLVYELYGLKEKEIQIVEEATA